MSIYQKVFFYLSILLFLIFCPILLLYSFGHLSQTDLEAKGKLYLSTTPENASVYINNRRYAQKTPVSISDMLPGTYGLKLTLNGYKPCNYRINVAANRTIYLDKILFTPEIWPKEELIAEPFANLIPIPETNFFILTKGTRLKDYFIYDLSRRRLTPLAQKNPVYNNLVVTSQDIVPNSSMFILRTLSDDGQRILLVKPQEYLIDIKDITGLFTEDSFQISWSPDYEDYIFSLQGNYLNLINVKANGVLPRFFEDARGFGFLERGICIINNRGNLLWADYRENRVLTLLEDPLLADFIFPEEGFVQVKPLGGDIILFLSEKGELTANVEPYRFVRNVVGITPSQKTMRVLFWQKNRIGLLDFRIQAQRKVDFELIPQTALLYGQGRDLAQAFWVSKESQVLFRDGKDVFLFELIRGSGKSINTITQVFGDSSIFYSENTGLLYYLDPSTAHLFAVKLIPQKGLAVEEGANKNAF